MFSTVGLRNAGAIGASAARRPADARLHQHLVELAVIGAGEHHDLVAAGDGARDAHRGHHRLGAGVAEGHPLVAGHLAEQRGDFAGQLRLRADREAFVQLLLDRLDDEIGRVPERGRAEAVEEVDVFVAVDVPDARAARAVADQRVDQLLPFRPEAGRRAGIGERRPRCGRALLGASRLRRQTRGERVDVPPLRWG